MSACAPMAASSHPPDIIVVARHSSEALDRTATIAGVCPDGRVSVERELSEEVAVRVRYGRHHTAFGADDAFARDLVLVQHTGYATLMCRPNGGADLHVTSADLTRPDAYFYTVTHIRPDATIGSYSGLLSETRSSVRRFLPDVRVDPEAGVADSSAD